MAAVAAWDLMPFLLFGSSSALSTFVALKSSSFMSLIFRVRFVRAVFNCFPVLPRLPHIGPIERAQWKMGKKKHKKHQQFRFGELSPFAPTADDGSSLHNIRRYAPPPDPPPFEPPADHPVEKDDEAVANDEAENPPAEGSGPPAGEEVPSEEKVETSEAPEAVPENEAPADGVLTAEPISDSDHPGNPGDEVLGAEAQTQESSEGSGNPEPTADTAPIDLAVDDGGNEGGENRHKEAEFPPIEPGEVDEDTKAGEPVVNVPADEVVEAAPITSPEAAPAVEPTPDAATTEHLPPATAGPADDKAGKKSKKSSKTKEKESKSKIKAKEKEKAKEAEKEKEKEKDKDKSKEKEKEKAKSSGKKKKGKAKVDPVALPNDEPGPSPDGSCPPDASAVETQAEA
ncbi:MAG: hypothetical protein L6R42_010968, partial [Xanthoria sp. 1 TBL-2021]